MDGIRGVLEPSYVLELMDGLLVRPDSLYRAKWLADNPQKPDPASNPAVLQFYGWSQDTRVLLGMHNLLATMAVGGKKARDHILQGPSAGGGKPRLVAKTLAEFTAAGMFAAMDELAYQYLDRQ
jgi:hypothetical protein